MVSPNDEWVLGTLKPVSPLLQDQLHSQQLEFPCVIDVLGRSNSESVRGIVAIVGILVLNAVRGL